MVILAFAIRILTSNPARLQTIYHNSSVKLGESGPTSDACRRVPNLGKKIAEPFVVDEGHKTTATE
jgi:hypothetical protein